MAEDKAAKIKSTIVKRAIKFIKKALPCEDMDAKACMKAIKEKGLGRVAKGLMAACIAQSKKKWEKKLGTCTKKDCSKNLLCKRCTKGIVSKIEGAEFDMTNSPGDMDALEAMVPPMLVDGPEGETMAQKRQKELAGKDTPSPSDNLGTALDAPGNIPIKSKSDDDDDETEKRAKRLLKQINGVSKSDEEPSDDDWEKLAKRLDKVVDGQVRTAKRIYQETAIRV